MKKIQKIKATFIKGKAVEGGEKNLALHLDLSLCLKLD